LTFRTTETEIETTGATVDPMMHAVRRSRHARRRAVLTSRHGAHAVSAYKAWG